MNVRRPELPEFFVVRVEAHAAQVSRQRIPPDIEDMRRIVRQRNTPFERRPADRQVLQAAANERADLIATSLGPDELRILLVEFQQLVLESRKSEKIAFFLEPLGY